MEKDLELWGKSVDLQTNDLQFLWQTVNMFFRLRTSTDEVLREIQELSMQQGLSLSLIYHLQYFQNLRIKTQYHKYYMIQHVWFRGSAMSISNLLESPVAVVAIVVLTTIGVG